MAHFAEEVSHDVVDLVVSDRREPSTGAAHCMLDCELFAKDTVGRQVWRAPTIPLIVLDECYVIYAVYPIMKCKQIAKE